MNRSLALFCSVVLLAAPVEAQRPVVYDTLTAMSGASVTCGFCAGEKFGVVFRELPGARPGLRASEFPLTVNSIEIAVASAMLDLTDEGLVCRGSSAGGEIDVFLQLYAGSAPPTGSILNNPDEEWDGEELVWSDTVPLQRSVEEGGVNMYNIMFNTITVGSGVRVDPPNTYLRVVMTIPAGGAGLECLGSAGGAPGALAIRDVDGVVANEVNFIYSVGGEFAEGWHWNETVCNALTCLSGDWAIRLNVTPLGSSGTGDAGVSPADAGTVPGTDGGGTVNVDAGVSPMDGGSTSMCSMDSQCAGGERCVDGMCRRIACTAASDCAGGMTCVDGMCRNLCDSNAECRGGEVCDMAAGHCVPVASGGCGCHVAGSSRSVPALALLVGALVFIRRSRR